MAQPFTVILNPGAGSARAELSDRIQTLFRAEGAEARIVEPETGSAMAELARQAAANAPAVVAAGGDGTVNTVAAALAGTGVPCGVLPLGTLNHFARDLKIPSRLEEAVRTVVAGRVAEVDAGEVNGRIFVNNSSLGLYPMIVMRRESYQRLGSKKWPAFLWAAATALRRYPFLKLRFAVDGEELQRTTPFVFVGNNVYEMEGLRIGTRRSLADERLCLYVLHRTGRLGLLALSLSAILGRLRAGRNFDAIRAREVWIDSRREFLSVALDGEVTRLAPPLHYRIRPRALRVLVP